MTKKKKSSGLIKGVPTAVLASILIHGGIFLVAGGLVVFSVVKKMEKKFEPPPPVQRQKMELKKPKVKVKKRVRPKSSTRITSKNVQGMTQVHLPEMPSMAEGLGGGVGGFELMPDAADIGLFGSKQSSAVGNDFEGTFYSLEMRRDGSFDQTTPDAVNNAVKRFIDAGCNPRVFAPYYRSPQKLYTTHFMIPPIVSERGPAGFGIQLSEEVSPAFWVVHYTGKIANAEGGRFRFRGAGDNFMAVMINKEPVLVCGFTAHYFTDISDWRSDHEDNWKYIFGHGRACVGTWFDLEPGVPVQMDVIGGDYAGGWYKMMIVVEKEGGIYPKNADGMPILPAFKTAEFPKKVENELLYLLTPGEVDLDSDLMFNMY